MRKQLVFMALMLATIAAAASDFFLEGAFNSWTVGDQRYKFTENADGSYTFDYNGTFSGEFLINDGQTTVAGSDASALIPGKPYHYSTSASASRIALYCNVRSAVFTLHPSRGTVIVEPIGVQSIPSGYYSMIMGLTDRDLKSRLKQVCKYDLTADQEKTYSNLSTTFKRTDVYPGTQYWWDMYSDELTDISLVFGNQESAGGGGMNREHSFPKSWWGGTNVKTPAYCDLFHLYPAKAAPNNAKSNNPLGIVASASYNNGVSKVGSPAPGTGGGSKKVFEPSDEYKGDFARSYFYMVTVYSDLTWVDDGLTMLYNNEYPTLQPWAISMLLDWSRNDPVSNKEIIRNEMVYQIQKNRNPFIDYPELAEYIWGTCIGQPFTPGSIDVNIPVESIAISRTSMSLTVGNTFNLTATISPTDASNRNITWTSDNTSVATVTSDGLVAAIAPGTAIITVTSVENPAITASCTITVNTAGTSEPVPTESVIEPWSTASVWSNKLPSTSANAGTVGEYTSTKTGITYTMLGVYRPSSYIMFNSKVYDAFIEFSLPFDCSSIIVTTSNSCSENADSKIDVYADGYIIADGLSVNEHNKDYEIELPDALRNRGTVYRIARNNNKCNQQFTKFTFVPATPPAPVVTIGDVDGNGSVTVSDVVIVVNYILGNPVQTFIFDAADVNGDGSISTADIVSICNIALTESK